jgi:hypothetical protein
MRFRRRRGLQSEDSYAMLIVPKGRGTNKTPGVHSVHNDGQTPCHRLMDYDISQTVTGGPGPFSPCSWAHHSAEHIYGFAI